MLVVSTHRPNSAILLLACIIMGVSLLTGCGSTGKDDAQNNDEGKEQLGASFKQFGPECGMVVDGSFQGGATSDQALFASAATAMSSNVLALHLADRDVMVKIFGLRENTSNSAASMSWINTLAQAGVYFVPASNNCTAPTAVGEIATGQVLTPGGRSFTESLIKAKLAGEIEDTGPCGENLISDCYESLYSAVNTPSSNNNSSSSSSSSSGSSSSGEGSSNGGSSNSESSSSSSSKTAGEITNFLWKPAADSSYNKGMLVIHVDECNATVYVNGEKLRDYGPGNGRCNTSRGFKPGCAYGDNVKVSVVDNASGRYYTRNGKPYVLVPNGCNRFEFKG